MKQSLQTENKTKPISGCTILDLLMKKFGSNFIGYRITKIDNAKNISIITMTNDNYHKSIKAKVIYHKVDGSISEIYWDTESIIEYMRKFHSKTLAILNSKFKKK